MNDRVVELYRDIHDAVTNAASKGSFMVAIFYVQDGHIKLTRKSSLFPVDDFDAVVDLLDQNLREEKKRAMNPFSKPIVKEPIHG